MKVFVAGATGAVGIPTVERLLTEGHDVVGMTRRNPHRLEALGVRAFVADALDRDAVFAAVGEVRPHAVVQLLTALPPRGPMRESDLATTNRLRIEGTAALLRAAVAAGVRRYVSESIVLGYGSGHTVFTEDDPFAQPDPAYPYASALNALGSLERQVTTAPLEGIVLRLGLFYGPTSGSTTSMASMLRKRLLRLPPGEGVMPWIHVEDVASAIAAALEHGRGGEVYNIVDDEATTTRAFAEEMARALGVPPPRSIPASLARVAAPYLVDATSLRLRVSNDKAKRDLGWSPRYPTIREGMAATFAPAIERPRARDRAATACARDRTRTRPASRHRVRRDGTAR